MARALIVGCGCRGRALGLALAEQGWAVRGTTRSERGLAEIEAAGIEGALADPDRVGTVLEHVADVAVVVHLLGWIDGETGQVEALHGPRLERLLEKLVDSPVRGFVYETGGRSPKSAAVGIVSEASARWRIPFGLIEAERSDHRRWLAAASRAVSELLGAS